MAYYKYPYDSKRRKRKPRQGRTGRGVVGFLVMVAVAGIVYFGVTKWPEWKENPPSLNIFSKTIYVQVDENTLTAYKNKVAELADNSEDHEITTDPDRADINVVVTLDEESSESGKCEPLYQIDLFPVMRFATLEDNITLEKLKDTAEGESSTYEFVTAAPYSEAIAKVLEIDTVVGGKSAENRDMLIEYLEADSDRIAMVPTSWLGPQLKMLEVDSEFPLDVAGMFRTEAYLCDEASTAEGADPIVTALKTFAEENESINSVSLENTATVIQTGVTAMGRNLWTKMREKDDPAWVARKIGEFLSDADLTHTSNEVSFAENCSQKSGTMSFCSDPDFIEALEFCGIDLVELTGNHNNDWGRDDAEYSIELYKEHEIEYFGGGLNNEDAKVPYLTEIKGTKIGFLGYNYYDSVVSGNPTPLATTTLPGANRYDKDQVEAEIKSLKDGSNDQPAVDIVIVDLQFQECWCYSHGNYNCYKPNAVPNQQAVFQQTRDMGADIVVGTQAHQPQGFEMSEEGALFFGLGNLFFDQTVYLGTREEEIIKHYFYNGQHLTSRVYTAMYDKDYQPYLVTGDTREEILEKLFEASGWNF